MIEKAFHFGIVTWLVILSWVLVAHSRSDMRRIERMQEIIDDLEAKLGE